MIFGQRRKKALIGAVVRRPAGLFRLAGRFRLAIQTVTPESMPQTRRMRAYLMSRPPADATGRQRKPAGRNCLLSRDRQPPGGKRRACPGRCRAGAVFRFRPCMLYRPEQRSQSLKGRIARFPDMQGLKFRPACGVCKTGPQAAFAPRADIQLLPCHHRAAKRTRKQGHIAFFALPRRFCRTKAVRSTR